MASRRVQPAGKHSAAQSHQANDQYMNDWEKAYEELRALNSPYAEHTGGNSGARPGALRLPADTREAQPVSYRAPASGRAGTAGSLPDRDPPSVTSGWRSGPINPQGVICDVSDRPNLCSSAHWQRGEIVIGSSDHALYIIDVQKGTRKRTLYNKSCGHSEWVTCCTFLPSGQVVSGGMDSHMWLWPAGGVRGCQVSGHGGPVSQVAYDSSSGLVASCSYDKSVKLWDMSGSSPAEVGAMIGHVAPVLEMALSPDGLIATGDRSGHVMVWDSSTCSEAWHLKRVHQGHITALAWFDYDSSTCAGCFVTGGQDGYVRVWDPRDHSCLSRQELHVNEQGRGAVGDIRAGGAAAGDMIISAGADGTLCVSDPRKSFGLMHQIQLSNFPYAMAAAGGLALVGCGDGSLWVVHASTGQVCYCLGANKHAVRCIEACEDKLMASGDDGKVLLWHFT